MKKLALLIIVSLIIFSCTATKENAVNRKEQKLAEKLADQVMVKKAVESRRYIIKMNRLYTTGGGSLDLVPRSNFIIVNGGITSVSLGYVGRTYASRPISGINFNGQCTRYDLKLNETKGLYDITMTVKKGNDAFDLYITIGNEGYCSVSLNNANIQTVSYRGTLTPLAEPVKKPDVKPGSRI